ncbi:hypothetical protein EON83_20835 [bacterium]|nr:MAG: hypothetical protein EON83_20835 [bacterium]
MNIYRLSTEVFWGVALFALSPLLAGCERMAMHDATTITDVNLSTDEAGKHVSTTFKPGDHTIYASGYLNSPGKGVKMKAVWTQVNAGGVKNHILYENDFTLDGETSTFAGNISRQTDWPIGTYTTEFYFAGRVSHTIDWKVSK